MPDVQRFFVFMAAALLLFVALLMFTVRNRARKPSTAMTFAIGFVVVVLGMLFARYSHLVFPHLSWVVYYGIPALVTVLLPPIWLRMTRREIVQYLPLAWSTAPIIHLLFSLLIGWHDYMPFPAYIPSVAEMIRRSAH
jgi:glycerol uptake facilitator-like aquaporin